MGVLEIQDLKYSYDNKKNVLNGINAQMELGKIYAILGHLVVGKRHYFLYLVDWIVLQKVRFYLMEKILLKRDWKTIVTITFLLSFKHII